MTRVTIEFSASGDASKLRALVDRLEAHERISRDPRFSHAVWEAERESLIARVNAHAALLMHQCARQRPALPPLQAEVVNGDIVHDAHTRQPIRCLQCHADLAAHDHLPHCTHRQEAL